MRYSHSALAEDPAFVSVLRNLAASLKDMNTEMPRLGRLLVTHQRWMLTHAAMMLYFDEAGGGLTIKRLRDVVTGVSVASHNTAQNYLEQIENYRIITRIEGGSRRKARRYVAAPVAEEGMFRWYLANLAALDTLDGHNRAALLMQRPHLFSRAHPRMAQICLDAPEWCHPPPRVAEFLWTEAGGLVVDLIISRIGDHQLGAERISIGEFNARNLADEFAMSRTHLQRLLRKCEEQGSIGWDSAGKGTRARKTLWLSRAFLGDYCAWQAVKFAAVNDAFLWALENDNRPDDSVLQIAV